eukprot:SAG31_NODE_3881_length_3789_cov_2.824390_6_plen_218_part_00
MAFLRTVAAWIGARAALTSKYALGHSNGAMMAYRLLCEAPDVFVGVAPVNGGFFGAPPSFLVASSEAVPNGWRTTAGDCGPDGPSFPRGSAASSCWTADAFSTGRHGNASAANARPVLTINGEDDTEEPYELVVAQYRHYATTLVGCDPRSERVVFTRGQSTCLQFESCVDGARPALCSVAGLGHGMPSQGQHGIDAVDVAIEYWRGGWPQHWNSSA